jgi:hypothetical protein
MIERMQRAARLDATVYNEVEQDTSATTEALQVVVIAAGCSALGAVLGIILFGGNEFRGQGGMLTLMFIGMVLTTLLSWVVWAYVTYFVGTALMGGTATPGEMLRTLGFAMTPQVFNILGFIPCLGGLIVFATGIWSLISGVVAVREALDISTGQAIVTCIVGWVLMMVLIVGVSIALAIMIGVPMAIFNAAR